MEEFYHNYTVRLLKNIFLAYKEKDKKAVKEYALELKELNKSRFLDKQLIFK